MRTGARPESLIELAGVLARQVPDPHFDVFGAFAAARCIMAGQSLGVFESTAREPLDAAELAARLDLDPHGTALLCTALHSLGYLDADGDRYRPGAPARRFLAAGREQDLRHWVGEFGYDMWDAFASLEDSLRSGRPIGLHDKDPGDPYWERYMRGLRDISRLAAPHVAGLVPVPRGATSLLDAAGGHGAYSAELCRRHDGLCATIVELEGAARIGERLVAEEAGVQGRIRYLVGDLFERDLGGPHDAAMANQIVHHLAPEQAVALAARIRAALRPGCSLAVFEQEAPAPGRRGSSIGTLTGVLFFITSGVRTYTSADVEGFLAEAGFERVRTRRHVRLPGTMVVIGDAPGG